MKNVWRMKPVLPDWANGGQLRRRLASGATAVQPFVRRCGAGLGELRRIVERILPSLLSLLQGFWAHLVSRMLSFLSWFWQGVRARFAEVVVETWGALHRANGAVQRLRRILERASASVWAAIRWSLMGIVHRAQWWWAVLVSAVQHFERHDCVMRAAAISYFGLISFFPLVLVLITLVSYFLEVSIAQKQVLDLIVLSAPTAGDLVKGNMGHILRYRNTVGLLAIAGFFWSASAVFSTIDRALNRIWDVRELRPYWRSKLLSILVIVGIGGLSVGSMATTALVNLLRGVVLPLLSSQFGVSLGPWRVVVFLIPYITNFLLFMFVYGVFPHTRVNWLHIWPGALLAAIVWEQAKTLFTDYLATFGSTNLVYGSVGAIIALMVWFYLSALILLMGAEISAAYSRAVRHT